MDAAQLRRLVRVFPGLVAFSLLGSLLLADVNPPAASGTLALVGGRVVTQTDAGTVEGTVLIRDGKIVAVGKDVAVPEGATRIDVAGAVITPGLIDARGTLGLSAAEIRDAASDGGLDVLDGVNPHHEDWKEVARQGVTAVYVQPASSGLLGGRGAVLRVAPGQSVEELVLKPAAGAQAALGTTGGEAPTPTAPTGGTRRGRGGPRPAAEPEQPAAQPQQANNALTRFAQYEQLKRALEGAKKYDEDRTKQEEAAKKPGAPPLSRPDPTREFLRLVAKRQVPLRLEAHREDDLRNALRLADELRIRVVLDGVSNPGSAAEGVVSRKLPLVLGPFVELEDVPAYRRNRPSSWPKTVLTPETRWALGTFSTQPRGSRLLRVHAAAAVALGIDPDSVLRAMTRDAAELLNVGDRVGTVAAGKQADLAVFAGDPLDPSVPVRLVLSGGRVVYRDEIRPEPVAAAAVPRTVPELPTRLPKKYALRTQRLITDDGTPQPGVVVVDDGKVIALGPNVVTEGMPAYDLGSTVLTPGLIAGPNTLGVIDDPVEADAGQVRAADAFDPQHRRVRALLEGGFTTALLAPGSANVIGGTASGVRLGAAEPLLGDAAVKFSLTTGSRGSGRTAADPTPGGLPQGFGSRASAAARYPASLTGQVELIEMVLDGKGPTTELYLPRRVRDQMQAERRRQITALRERKLVACFEAQTRAEIAAALQLIERFELRAVLLGAEEVGSFTEDIRRLKVGIVARPIEPGDYDRPVLELARAAPAGVPVAFGSGTAQELRITAAMTVNAGLPREAAWRGLTTASAQMLGLPATAGKLAVGAPADLVVWNESPLDVRGRALRVVVDGKIVYAAQ
jgi:imidazolonepropionase-like amidohydrolase